MRIEVEEQPNAAAARAGVRDESLDAALVGDGIVSLKEPPAELVQLLQASSRLVRTEQALQREGLSGDERIRALQQPPLPTVALEGEDDGSEGVAFVASLVLYLQLIMYGIAVASGVVEEKSSRVIEVLLATVQPRAILAGKILGIGALGLLQLTLTACGRPRCGGRERCDRARARRRRDARRRAAVVPARLPRLVVALRDGGRDGVPPRGSPVLDHGAHAPARDRLPARIPGDRRSGRGGSRSTASIFPLFAPIVMPLRVALDAASAVEIAASLALLVASIAVLVPLGARLYERSVLRMGKPMKLREAWRAARA